MSKKKQITPHFRVRVTVKWKGNIKTRNFWNWGPTTIWRNIECVGFFLSQNHSTLLYRGLGICRVTFYTPFTSYCLSQDNAINESENCGNLVFVKGGIWRGGGCAVLSHFCWSDAWCLKCRKKGVLDQLETLVYSTPLVYSTLKYEKDMRKTNRLL